MFAIVHTHIIHYTGTKLNTPRTRGERNEWKSVETKRYSGRQWMIYIWYYGSFITYNENIVECISN